MRLVVINDNCYWVLRVGERLRLGAARGGAFEAGWALRLKLSEN